MKTFDICGSFTNNFKRLPICVSLFLDDQIVWSKDILDSEEFNLELDDNTKRNYTIRIRFEGKTGVADSDTQLTCNHLKVNQHSLDYILQNTARFYHSYNSPDPWDQEMEYSNIIGIDGDLVFELETPVAFWFGKRDKW
jgi:hypothetical protein